MPTGRRSRQAESDNALGMPSMGPDGVTNSRPASEHCSVICCSNSYMVNVTTSPDGDWAECLSLQCSHTLTQKFHFEICFKEMLVHKIVLHTMEGA